MRKKSGRESLALLNSIISFGFQKQDKLFGINRIGQEEFGNSQNKKIRFKINKSAKKPAKNLSEKDAIDCYFLYLSLF